MGKLPVIKLPIRSLDNVEYDKAKGYFELGDACAFADSECCALLRSDSSPNRDLSGNDRDNDFATKREAYYISKNWGDCRFEEQTESDATMDVIAALSMHGLSREQLRFHPESHGGSLAGRLKSCSTETRQRVRSLRSTAPSLEQGV
jgi:DNA topoisomerase VI subunit A